MSRTGRKGKEPNVRPSPFECVCDAFLFVSGEAMRSALSLTIQRMTTLLPFAFGRSPSSSSRVMVAVEGGRETEVGQADTEAARESQSRRRTFERI